MHLCLIYNFAQHYRTSIFKLIDQEFDCDFVFGDSMSDVKKMDYSLLQGGITEVATKRLWGGWYYQPGVPSLLRKGYDTYILLGETRALSTWLFCLKAKLFHPEKKVFFWSHGWYGKETRSEKRIKKLLFNLPNGGIFLYGNYARDLMIKEGFNPEKLFVIHNSLAYDEQVAVRKQLTVKPLFQNHFDNDYPNLIFVGRLTAIKKLDMILRAMALLKGKKHNYNLTLVGGGEKVEELKSLSKQLDLENNVWFYGPCYEEQVLGELLYNADLCVSPGNVGLTAMHSMVFGTPVLTHDDFPHQMPEFEAVQKEKTGDFFKYDDVDDLAAKINSWFVKMGERREEVRSACMNEIDNYWTPLFQIQVLKKHLQ
jgi:glycosyltransferase involved in cell wall biosynthesis